MGLPHFDQQANTRLLTDENATLTDSYHYTTFGEKVGRSGLTINPLEFGGMLGYYRDIAERLYVRARYLNIGQGRWMKIDPIGFLGGDVNLFRFVQNNPLAESDPLGLQNLEDYWKTQEEKRRQDEYDRMNYQRNNPTSKSVKSYNNPKSGGLKWPNPRKGFWTGDLYAPDNVYNDAINGAGDWWYNDYPGRGWYGEWSPKVPKKCPVKPKVSLGWTVDNGWAISGSLGKSGTNKRGWTGGGSLGYGYSQGSGAKFGYGLGFNPDINAPIDLNIPLTPTIGVNTSDPLNGGKYTIRGGFRDTRKKGTGLGFGGIWGIPPSAKR